ncbi:MAG: DUF2550 domain-containing protein [Streptosporangiaceae bacterium]
MAGGLALIAGWGLLLVLAAAGLIAVTLATRRILLGRSGGTVECGLRASPAVAWRLGLAAYQPDQLSWFSAFGLRLRPDDAFGRRSLTVLARRPANPAEVVSIGTGTVVIECQIAPDGHGTDGHGTDASRTVELAMSEEALTGFLSWLESAAPGHASGLS